MKRFAILLIAASLLTGCGDAGSAIFGKPTPEPTPEPPPTKATPKPGDWMWKDYKNPLEQRPR
jgi:hypothetical protein